jgi:hypothetical protein
MHRAPLVAALMNLGWAIVGVNLAPHARRRCASPKMASGRSPIALVALSRFGLRRRFAASIGRQAFGTAAECSVCRYRGRLAPASLPPGLGSPCCLARLGLRGRRAFAIRSVSGGALQFRFRPWNIGESYRFRKQRGPRTQSGTHHQSIFPCTLPRSPRAFNFTANAASKTISRMIRTVAHGFVDSPVAATITTGRAPSDSTQTRVSQA